jgi:phosphate:Na+ symporter
MTGTVVLFELAGYVGLLLWGTHMVTTGMQRGFGAELRRWLGRNLHQPWRAFLAGLGVTALLQSSTATGLMATSFTAAGLLGLGPALAVMLGANVGTTLITQVLSFKIGPVGPPLVLAGVLAFRWSDDDRIKNLGRIAIGLGLMLMALAGLVDTLTPLEKAPALTTVLKALGDQPILCVLIAAIVTWGCHSSVAVVLLITSLASTHIVDLATALALILGANVGGTLPPLIEAESPPARRLPLGNALVRGIGCVAALPFLPTCVAILAWFDPTPGRLVVNFHTAFNLLLAAVFIFSTGRLAQLLIHVLPDPPHPADPGKPIYLEPAALDEATVALANASRETLRIADMLEAMLRGAMEVFRQNDRRRAREISRMDRAVDQLGAAIRGYLADLGNEQPLDDEEEGARAQEILSVVINLEHVGDIVANNLMEFAVKKMKGSHSFAAEELDIIARMISEVIGSLHLGIAVFLNGDARYASRLVARKAPLRRIEVEATALHIQLLRNASGDNLARAAEEGGLFLRIVRDLRRVHSHIAALAYPALNRSRGGAPVLAGTG